MAERAILRVDLATNSTDEQIYSNLEASRERGLEELRVSDVLRGVPLILCGSGPSIKKYFPIVRKLFPDADIMAVNGAYRWLRSQGIDPQYYAQLDARENNLNFVENPSSKTLHLLASQVHPNIFQALEGRPIRMIHLLTPSVKQVFPKAHVMYGSAGGTIGTTAMGIAGTLGYRQILLLGFDSSYEGAAKHILHQAQNDGTPLIDAWIDEKQYWTSPNMVKQVEVFRSWVGALEKSFEGYEVRLFGEGLLYDYLMHGQQRERTRETEVKYYSDMYREEASYGMTADRAAKIEQFLSERDRGSYLDVSTGRGEAMDIARKLGYHPVRGTEAVPELVKSDSMVWALLPELPFADGEFDTVTCFEVIEHLLPADVIPALRELKRVAKKRVIVSLCTVSSIQAGVELHPSYRSEEEWRATLEVAWGRHAHIKKIGEISICEGKSPAFELNKEIALL